MAVLKFLYGCAILFLIWFDFGFCQDFGYDGSEGPTHWGETFLKCIGKHQSPIDIEAKNVKVKKFPELVFENFDKPLEEVSMENNGHTVLFKITKGAIPTIHGGPLKAEYRFAQLHFHWGPNDTVGSENQINHKSYPLELHMVMVNTKYPDLNAALDHKDGLTVLSFLYLASDYDNYAYDQFEEGLLRIQEMATSTFMTNFVSLDDFSTRSRSRYFTYEGSLTTPPCSEIVTWIEFISTIPVSTEQIRAFRSISSKHGLLTHNYRPIQPIHGRIIYMNSARHCKSRVLIVILALFIPIFRHRFS